MSKPFYMRLNWAHYHEGTSHLRNEGEHGAYLLLIGALFSSGGKLKADDDTLARHAHCTAERWAELRPVVLPFFKVTRGMLRHKRVSEELAHIGGAIGQRKAAGKAGGLATAEKHRGNGAASAAASAAAKRTELESESQSVDPKADALGARAPKLRATRTCPALWEPSHDDVTVGLAKGLTLQQVFDELEKIRDHEFAAARSNWSATFRNWLRRAAERNPDGRPGADPKLTARHANYAAAQRGADAAAGRHGEEP